MATTQQLYETYVTKMRRIADIRAANALMQWDQETYLPAGGAQFRGQQISTLSELAHRFFTEEELGDVLNELLLRDDVTLPQKRNVEKTRDDYAKAKKYSSAFVVALSEQVAKTFHAWIEARKENRFAVYEKDLDALVKLKKEETFLLGYNNHPYDALLDEFEKGATVALLDTTFDALLPQLSALFNKLMTASPVDDSPLLQRFPKEEQWDWGMHLLQQLHFDFAHGRQDRSEHPFSTSFSPQDVRITTRIDEADFGNMTWSCIHEAGHALYEQGLPVEQYGLPLGEACSYSIHESQSRLWENNVGRSKAFWQHHYPTLQGRFPQQLGDVPLNGFYKAINKVQPSLIRTEADEITYHFHVYIRYELEKRLMEGSLSTADIPQFWNEQYKSLLGVSVPDDKRGCLQDVHWSHGSFGYFPTYSLGSFYAAQFFAAAEEALPGLKANIANGQSLELLQWLHKAVHAKGRFHTSEGMCKEITGEGLNPAHFMRYATEKYEAMYFGD